MDLKICILFFIINISIGGKHFLIETGSKPGKQGTDFAKETSMPIKNRSFPKSKAELIEYFKSTWHMGTDCGGERPKTCYCNDGKSWSPLQIFNNNYLNTWKIWKAFNECESDNIQQCVCANGKKTTFAMPKAGLGEIIEKMKKMLGGRKNYLIQTKNGNKIKHGKFFLVSTEKKTKRKGHSKKATDYQTSVTTPPPIGVVDLLGCLLPGSPNCPVTPSPTAVAPSPTSAPTSAPTSGPTTPAASATTTAGSADTTTAAAAAPTTTASGVASGASCTSYPQDHTMNMYAGPSDTCAAITQSRGFNDAGKNLIVKAHNELRQKVASGQESNGAQPGASNMRKLVWNNELEEVAQRWVDQCKGAVHDMNSVMNMCDGTAVGQNIYSIASFGSSTQDQVMGSVDEAVRQWYSEVQSPGFDSSKISPFQSVPAAGHYTQLVWADTYAVGCGMVNYQSNTVIACNYAVGGNVIGGTMYEAGTGCANCPPGTSCDSTFSSLCATTKHNSKHKETESTRTNDFDLMSHNRNG